MEIDSFDIIGRNDSVKRKTSCAKEEMNDVVNELDYNMGPIMNKGVTSYVKNIRNEDASASFNNFKRM